MVVATALTQDGHFWCQLLFPPSKNGVTGEGEEGGAYTTLQDELQATPARGEGDLFTPVFYSEGDVCAAVFSEDEEWYRARIEKVTPGMV